MSSAHSAPSSDQTPSTSLTSIPSLQSGRPAFSALLSRYTAQRSRYTNTALPSDVAQLFRTHLSAQLPLITKIVCLGLGTLTRIPNSRWDPESSTYQFILLEDIADLITVSHRRKQLRPGGSLPQHFPTGRNPPITPARPTLDIYLQDPAFVGLDKELITLQLPATQFLTANPDEHSPILSADPASQHIDENTLLYMPFLPADILIACLATRKPAIVICVDIAFLMRHILDNRSAFATCKTRGCAWFDVLPRFLDRYHGVPLPVGREQRWEEPFGEMTVYWRKTRGEESRHKGKERRGGCVLL